MHNDEEDRCGSWSDTVTVRSLEYTNQLPPGDQGVRLQGGWHFSRVSAYNQTFCKQCQIEAQGKNLPIRFNLHSCLEKGNCSLQRANRGAQLQDWSL